MTLTIILPLHQGMQDAVPLLLETLALPGKHSSRFIVRKGSHIVVLGREMLQEHQWRSLLRVLRVSINTAVWMVMWIDPVIQEQTGISNLCNVDLLASIVSKADVHVCTSC